MTPNCDVAWDGMVVFEILVKTSRGAGVKPEDAIPRPLTGFGEVTKVSNKGAGDVEVIRDASSGSWTSVANRVEGKHSKSTEEFETERAGASDEVKGKGWTRARE